MSNGYEDPRDQDQAQRERLTMVESKINLERAAEIGIVIGGLSAKDMAQVFEFAKSMSLSGPMVPGFLRGQPWSCFGICLQAIEWRMSPFAVARMAYEVENAKTGEKTVAYMSQLLHGVLESRQVLKERLRVRYEGEGDDMVCVVAGCFKNESEPREWRSPKLGDRRPKTQSRTNRKTGEQYDSTPGSPLWQSKPLVQLFYDTSRDWLRIYCPDVAMGIYGEDEMDEAGFDKLPAPPADDGGLSQRLSESALRSAGFSFNPSYAAQTIDGESKDADNAAQSAPDKPFSATDTGGGESVVPPSPSPSPTEARQAGSEPRQASSPPEGEEGRPAGSRRRPRPAKPDDGDAKLV